MTRSQNCAQSTSEIFTMFGVATQPLAMGTCIIGSGAGSAAFLGALPWLMAGYSGLYIINKILAMIGSPKARNLSSIVSMALNAVVIESGVEATKTSCDQTGNIADLSSFFLRMTLVSAVNTVLSLRDVLSDDEKPYHDSIKIVNLMSAMFSFVETVGWAALTYGCQWGWAVLGAATLLFTLISLPVTYSFFSSNQVGANVPETTDCAASQRHTPT